MRLNGHDKPRNGMADRPDEVGVKAKTLRPVFQSKPPILAPSINQPDQCLAKEELLIDTNFLFSFFFFLRNKEPTRWHSRSGRLARISPVRIQFVDAAILNDKFKCQFSPKVSKKTAPIKKWKLLEIRRLLDDDRNFQGFDIIYNWGFCKFWNPSRISLVVLRIFLSIDSQSLIPSFFVFFNIFSWILRYYDHCSFRGWSLYISFIPSTAPPILNGFSKKDIKEPSRARNGLFNLGAPLLLDAFRLKSESIERRGRGKQ